MPPTLSAAVLPVALSRGTARALPSVYHNGQQHIVAEPNKEFQVQVWVANPSHGLTYRVSLRIDGEPVGYSKFASLKNNFSTTFPGWYHNAGDGQLSYRHFKFGECRPSASATTVEHPDQIVAGKIEIKCDVVRVVGEKAETRHKQHASAGPLGNAASKKLPEGKKWFLQPGLKAETGSLSSRTDSWNTKQYVKLHELAPLKIKYDTAENLKLRNILKPSNPQHAAMLRSSSNPSVAALLGASSSRLQHHPSSSRHQPKQEQHRKGSKRRHAPQASESDSSGSESSDEDEDQDDGEIQIPRSATGEVVNLCEEDRPQPLKVNGRVLQSDELAICDLCDSDGERQAKGKWQIKKKPRIKVE